MPNIRTRHAPDCKISHPRGTDRTEAAWILGSVTRAARRDCPLVQSRTQPFHAFDIHADGGECEYCGTPWNPSVDGDADA